MSSAVEGHMPPSRGSRRLSGGEIGISTTSTLGGSGGGSLASMGKTPPATPKKVGGKMLAVKVLMLDDTYTLFQIQNKALGVLLLEQACRQLNLLESDYFGLEYTDGNTRYWLDLDKPLNRQVCLSQFEPVLRFCVKFYTPDPSQLEEEYTRYLFALQVKRDLSHGDLICNENTAAIMAAYIVQAECGDFVDEDYPDHRYLTLFRFTPNQDDLMERRIMENHRKHIGMTPAAADLNLLETARRCELYGIKMHPAKDHENVVLSLSVAHMGIVVFQSNTKINTFSWAKIRKISFKRKRFLIKLHPEGYGYYKDVVEFFFDGRNECKNFWKKCVEHHGFFRCSAIKKIARQKTRVLSKGSSFRYSGRTQKQVQEFVRENFIKRQPFQRSQSFRHSPSVHPGGMSSVGMSISAQPLVPLRDNQCVGTPASLSCGSMTIPSTAEPPSPVSHVDKEYKEFHEESNSVISDGHDPYGYNRRNNMEYTLSPASTTPTLSQSPTRHLGTPTPFTQTAQQKSRLNGSPLQSPSSKEDLSQKLQEQNASSPTSTIGSNSPTSIQTISTPKSGSAEPNIFLPLSPISPDISTSNKLDYMDFQNNMSNKEAIVANGRSEIAPLRLSKDSETKKRRHPGDRSYFIVKEMLTTERTYKKDLEVVIIWFREEVKKEDGMPNEVLSQLFGLIDPIYEFHSKFVKELDNRLAQWDGAGAGPNRVDSQRMGDLMMKVIGAIELYQNYFSQNLSMLESLEATFHKNKKFEQIYRDFDLQKVCYLPFTVFLLKPMHRLPHYHLLLDRLLLQYGSQSHPDYMDCMAAKAQLDRCVDSLEPLLVKSENFVKLVELQRDLVGIDNLVQPGREFIREGCLQKLSRKGYQQRMFFLFNDVLLYTNRTTTPILQFKVHGQLPLRGVMVEENECRMGATNCFTIYGGNRALMVAANSEEDKSRWLEDLSHTINTARNSKDETFHYLSLKSISCSDEVLDKSDLNSSDEMTSRSDKMGPQTRSNTTVHVCWHRATSVAKKDYINAVHNQLSGYLLRKFKNSMGWQKLWVVFTNFCLFFYKTFQDDSPLASLPLLGYTISSPGEEDQIQKEYVFKLQFKNHVYFFRAESEYTFSRWMEVIGSATKGSARSRLFSRMDSSNMQELQE